MSFIIFKGMTFVLIVIIFYTGCNINIANKVKHIFEITYFPRYRVLKFKSAIVAFISHKHFFEVFVRNKNGHLLIQLHLMNLLQ